LFDNYWQQFETYFTRLCKKLFIMVNQLLFLFNYLSYFNFK